MLPEVIIISGTFAPPPIFGLRVFYSGTTKPFEATGHTVHVENLLHLGLGNPAKAKARLEDKHFHPDDGRKFILIGHSQGGSHALDLANTYPKRVEKVVLLGAPGYGTRLAPVRVPIPAVRALSTPSRWLQGIRHHDNFDPTKVVSIFTAGDLLVFPWTSSIVDGAQNYLVVPKIFEWPAVGLGRILVQKKMDSVQVLHGTTEHACLPIVRVVQDVIHQFCIRPNHLRVAA